MIATKYVSPELQRGITEVPVWYRGIREGELEYCRRRGNELYSILNSDDGFPPVLMITPHPLFAVHFALSNRDSLAQYLRDISLGGYLIAEMPREAVRLIPGTHCGEYMDSYPIQAYAHPVDLDAITFRQPTEEELRIVRRKENPDLHYLI